MKSNFLRLICCTLIVLAAASCSKERFVYNEVSKAVAELNKKCPVTVDEDTRLDSVGLIEEPIKVTYHYTIVSFEKNDISAQINEVKRGMKLHIQKTVDDNPDMKFYRDNKIPLTYSYKDRNGEFLLDFTVTPKNKPQ